MYFVSICGAYKTTTTKAYGKHFFAHSLICFAFALVAVVIEWNNGKEAGGIKREYHVIIETSNDMFYIFMNVHGEKMRIEELFYCVSCIFNNSM
jgi:hypothetical protein